MQVVTEAGPLPLGTPKQQAVLALLAIRPGRLVTVEELIDELWPEAAPASAVANTRGYAAGLRRIFDRVDSTRGLLARCGPGYQFRAEPDDVDLLGFEAECERAGGAVAAGNLSDADDLFCRAEQRWRGPMLSGVPLGPVLSTRRTSAIEQRLGLVEQWAELCLATGRPRQAITMLREHLRANPLREHGHALLIRAHYQDADVPAALNAFATARALLIDQLGIGPGEELERLHKAVLNRDLPTVLREETRSSVPVRGADPTVISHARRAGRAPEAPTSWLPRPLADFTGRTDTVLRLMATVERAEPATSVVQMIDGMPGIGKTALAVHVATRLTERYPDAQLFIDLQGHSPARPVDPAAALVTLLRQLGVPAGRIPAELEHRIALWRSELAVRRAIVVLDNAGGRDQIEPLLPAAPGTLVLVTSRRRLLAGGGTPPESLAVFGEDDSIELLAQVAGRDRLRAEPEAVAAVVRRCGYLPLAIRLAGARLAHRPGWRVADLAQRLDRGGHALGELFAEDRTVAAVFALSYEPLREPVQRVFRLLGLYPGEHFGAGAVAALADLSLAQARLVLDELVDRHLVEEPRADRFRLHDLLRDYAEQLVAVALEPAERRVVIHRLLDHYLHLALVATRTVEPVALADQLGLGPPMRPDLVAAFSSVGPDWLEAERSNLLRLIRAGVEGGHLNEVWRLARVSWRFHFIYGYHDDILETQRHAVAAAESLGNLSASAAAHNYRAYAWLQVGDPQRALRDLERAIEVRESVDDRQGMCISRTNLAIVYCQLGRLTESLAIYRQSLADRRRWAIDVLSVFPSYGWSLMLLGEYREALSVHRLHLYLSRLAQSQFNIALALTNIGAVRVRLGQHEQAIRYLRAALRLKDRTGNPYGLPFALDNLGTAYRELGRLDEARECDELALATAIRRGESLGQAAALNGIGLTLAALGSPAKALEHHREALALATRASHPYEQGRALAAMAGHLETQSPAEARRHWERALAIFRKMGVPERFEVERELARLALPVER
ncbi:BTAD domain-containing putative transcriptional regulator [Plantactinospora sp. BB1]|uniref:AfsR/SARP family transcriptional regulator n=1 Tax=Plantactinospora sp. BB1 TaxID=2071627 RepID=UPI001F232E7E|nr:BTAD domain-containing putative transcriptional regulator [Plantactinospora sp. BB1]